MSHNHTKETTRGLNLLILIALSTIVCPKPNLFRNVGYNIL
jgi:ABC-type uncharacterized transport system permease subunit